MKYLELKYPVQEVIELDIYNAVVFWGLQIFSFLSNNFQPQIWKNSQVLSPK